MISVFPPKVVQISGHELTLLQGTILCSSPMADRPPTICRPSVSMETIVLCTRCLTFLVLGLASKGEKPVLSTMQSPGLVHAAKGTRHGGRRWPSVAPYRRWVFTTEITPYSAVLFYCVEMFSHMFPQVMPHDERHITYRIQCGDQVESQTSRISFKIRRNRLLSFMRKKTFKHWIIGSFFGSCDVLPEAACVMSSFFMQSFVFPWYQ